MTLSSRWWPVGLSVLWALALVTLAEANGGDGHVHVAGVDFAVPAAVVWAGGGIGALFVFMFVAAWARHNATGQSGRRRERWAEEEEEEETDESAGDAR